MGDLEKLYEMIDDLEIAMFTTRRPDGQLVSRAMDTQKRAPGADLWFMTTPSGKLDELEDEPNVNLAYYKDRTREWVSVSGVARLTQDPQTIRAIWADDWKMWLPEEGDPRHGTPDDPRIILIGVDVQSAAFYAQQKPTPVVLFELIKARVTGKEPNIGEVRRIN